MPMDMPPRQVVEYKVAPMPAEARDDVVSQVARFLGSERIGPDRRSGITISSFDAAQRLPAMDFRSKALTQPERRGMAAVLDASRAKGLETASFSMPDGYVARRMAAGIMAARLAHRSQTGASVTPAQIEAVRCRLVAAVMDPRAGRYVLGGERAAAASRASLTRGDVEVCRTELSAQAARLRSERSPVGASPKGSSLERQASVQPRPVVGLASVGPRSSSPVSIDPVGTKRVRIDPEGSIRRSVSPIGSRGPSSSRPGADAVGVGAHRKDSRGM